MTLSSTGADASIIDGPCENLQGGIQLSDDQQRIWNWPDEPTWSVDISEDGTRNVSPTPTTSDITNTTTVNPLPLPGFGTDTDWQFNFDMQYTAEQNTPPTSVIPTAINEPDVPQLYTRPIQGSIPTACSGDLIEYLSLGEKVSTAAESLA